MLQSMQKDSLQCGGAGGSHEDAALKQTRPAAQCPVVDPSANVQSGGKAASPASPPESAKQSFEQVCDGSQHVRPPLQ